jgi:hypothetical protein
MHRGDLAAYETKELELRACRSNVPPSGSLYVRRADGAYNL